MINDWHVFTFWVVTYSFTCVLNCYWWLGVHRGNPLWVWARWRIAGILRLVWHLSWLKFTVLCWTLWENCVYWRRSSLTTQRCIELTEYSDNFAPHRIALVLSQTLTSHPIGVQVVSVLQENRKITKYLRSLVHGKSVFHISGFVQVLLLSEVYVVTVPFHTQS